MSEEPDETIYPALECVFFPVFFTPFSPSPLTAAYKKYCNIRTPQNQSVLHDLYISFLGQSDSTIKLAPAS
jgi:hypothetical protein